MLPIARRLLLLSILLSHTVAADYDLVLIGGRAIDPESGLDAIRNVAVQDGKIVAVTSEPIEGTRRIDAAGLVVAPGFIDLHAHGQTNAATAYQARDGVTTALELESGIPNLTEWLAGREGNALVNFGASASQMSARALAKDKYASQFAEFRRTARRSGPDSDAAELLRAELASSVYDSLDSDEIEKMTGLIAAELEAGALGIGLPVGYQPGATREEIFELFRFAGARRAPIFVHVRDPGIPGIQEVIANSAATGAPLHIVHINSMALGSIGLGIDLVEAAQARGLDVTTEMYPYTAASTSLESALFDEGWQETLGGITYRDIQWQDTGERLTKETFEEYRAEGGVVIIHMMKDAWIDAGIARASTMIGSDGMPYAPGAHPRSAGTFARVLGRYVREREALTLASAIAKMTLMPARRLETITPDAQAKGRLQVDADADITVFDPERVIDTASFDTGLSFSEGIEYVIVNGVPVVDGGESVADVFPGKPLLGRFHSSHQTPVAAQAAIHIPASTIDRTIDRAPDARVSDQQIRHVEAADGNLGVGVVKRPAMAPVDVIRAIRHHDQSEVYRVVSGKGILATAPTMTGARPLDPDGATVRTLTGPSDFGIIETVANTYEIGAGDVVIIPAGIAHGFSEITEAITYLVVRIDPDKLVELK